MGEELVDQLDVAARSGTLTTAQSVTLVGAEDVQLHGPSFRDAGLSLMTASAPSWDLRQAGRVAAPRAG